MSPSNTRPMVSLQTRLTPDEFLERLDTIADRYRIGLKWHAILFGKNPLLARRNGDWMVLTARRYLGKSYCLYPFYGRLVPNGEGTLLTGRFGLGPETWVGVTIWWIISAAIVLAKLCLGWGQIEGPQLASLSFCAFVIPAAALWWGMRHARSTDNPVRQLLQRTFDPIAADTPDAQKRGHSTSVRHGFCASRIALAPLACIAHLIVHGEEA
jgi:hypothetical protein